jgi:hypothetical protein
MSPHETLFLESTGDVDIQYVNDNDFVKFQTWDFGGDINLQGDVAVMGQFISPERLFKLTSTLVYVIDAQEEDYEDALPKLAETISAAHAVNPAIHFEVFLHKIDGDIMSEERKAERKQVANESSSECAQSPLAFIKQLKTIITALPDVCIRGACGCPRRRPGELLPHIHIRPLRARGIQQGEIVCMHSSMYVYIYMICMSSVSMCILLAMRVFDISRIAFVEANITSCICSVSFSCTCC